MAAVLYLDLDRFKHVNDTLGHDEGDRLLQVVSERIAACVRESDLAVRPFRGADLDTAVAARIRELRSLGGGFDIDGVGDDAIHLDPPAGRDCRPRPYRRRAGGGPRE